MIRELKRKLAEAESGSKAGDRSEPIAIVATACRFPRSSDSPEAFWESLLEGRDETSELPSDRWDIDAYFHEDADEPGKMYARRGVFLDKIDGMDADFFGISPREATWIDPQQRVFLEVGWEAIERAGWAADVSQVDTGVFVGWMHNDYQNEASESLLDLNPYIATGSAGSFLCGRLSYYLGIQGPSLAVDTACSSSLVALHLACQSLRARECDRALAGGVNVMVSPKTTIMTCKLHALSPSGHSRAFDASADGYLRGEGCGIVALRRLSDAQRDGDEILAVIRGSAITHNGFSSGLTAPNPESQQRVIRKALENAGLQPSDIDYLEAHGTGTELGDPIELNAAAAVLGQGRDKDHPLLVGSVKTNLGHLEAAAGVAGIIKTVLAMKHGKIPAHLHFETPNPHIAWDRLPVRIVTEATEWNGGGPRYAGVSAFGMSGTNAHVVLEAPPERTSPVKEAGKDDAPAFLAFGAKNEEALRAVASSYLAALDGADANRFADFAFTAATRRRHFEKRAAIVAADPASAIEALAAVARGGEAAGACTGIARNDPAVAWQFTGQGSQYVGMGKRLYETEPVFRRVIDECASELAKHRKGDLVEVMFEDGDTLADTYWTQPALYAIHLALAETMKSWGYHPAAVLGHSLGQYAAATVAGMLDPADGMRLIHERARLVSSLPAGGAMAAVFADPEAVSELAESSKGLSVAARNGTHSVLSGPETEIDTVLAGLEKGGVRTKKLETSHAFHSALLDPILDEFEKVAASIEFRASAIPVVCNISGEALAPDFIPDGAYWRNQLREAVQFSRSIESLAEMRCDIVLELGPQPFLTGMAAASWTGSQDALVHSLRKDTDDAVSLREAVGRLFCQGAAPDFAAFLDPCGVRRRVALPTYPFQRERFWGPERPGALRVKQSTSHPLLGEERSLAGVLDERRYEHHVAPDKQQWLTDHRVFEDILFPGAGYVEMLAAATGGRGTVEEISFEMPLMVDGTITLQTVVKGDRDGGALEIHSKSDASPWMRHVSASYAAAPSEKPTKIIPSQLAQSCPEEGDTAAFYEMFAGLGIHYGPEFQTIRSLRYSDSEVVAKLELHSDQRGYLLPPMLLDGAFQTLAVGLLRDADSSLFLPVGIGRYRFHTSPAGGEIWVHGKWNQTEGDLRTADLTLYDAAGNPVASVEDLRVRAVSRTALRQMVGSGPERLLYTVAWRPFEVPALNTRHSQWLVVSDSTSWNGELAERLGAQNQHVIQVGLSSSSNEFGDASASVILDDENAWIELLTHYFPEEGPGQLNGIVWNIGDCPAESVLEGEDTFTKRLCTAMLAMLRALRARRIEWLDRGLQVQTKQAVPAAPGDPVLPESSQFWGFARVVASEYPSLMSRIIDRQGDEEQDFASVVEILLAETRENQFALRGESCFIPRLVPAKASQQGDGIPVVGGASYLVTGGLGMLGRRGGEWLAERGAEDVVLVSRREPTESTLELIAAIEEKGCRVHVMLADIGVKESVVNLLARIEKKLPPLKGILHAAGVLDDGLLVEQTWDRFEKVLDPKKRGAALLDQLTRGLDLDFFVLYSSAASVLGSPGQTNYATGNAYLDGLAYRRVAEGLPTVAVNFGPWNEGMAASETVTKATEFQGITPLTADEAHEAVERLFDNEIIQATMLDTDWGRMRQRFPVEAPPLLDELWPANSGAAAGPAVLLEKLREAEAAGEPREEVFRQHIANELQQVLSLPEPPGDDVPLAELGLDSLMAVEFSSRLQQQVGHGFPIPPTLAFDYPSVAKLTARLMEMIDSVPAAETPVTVTASSDEDAVVIVGMGCRFPGAEGPEAYWELLRNGIDATCEIPSDRWDMDALYSPERAPGKMYVKRGGFLPDIGDFDAEFFGLSETDAAWMDPQHRMLLETSWQAMENAGIVPDHLEGDLVGVFMGIMSTDYAQIRERIAPEELEGSQGAGLSHSAGVGRISYLFGFEGPSIAVDTASSSSLVAVCQAVRSLMEGECDLALAGGVNAILSPVNSLLLCKGGVLSPDGRSKSFSAAADGFGRGEGCGVVVLKRRSDALRDGDRILATVRGTAIGHNGHNGGLTAPSGKSQAHMLRRALAKAGLKPSDIDYLEAHATGTELGDPIELQAAAEVFGNGRAEDAPLLVGSAKANLGHLEAAGGISGLIKLVLSMQHGTIPGQIHFDEPSPHVAWDRLRLRVVADETPWPNPQRRIGGVSALGMTGTNAHIILEGEAPPEAPSVPPPRDKLLVASARSASALAEMVDRYRKCIAALDEVGFAAFCDSAATGRKPFSHRIALVAETPEETLGILSTIPANPDSASLFAGDTTAGATTAWIFGGEGSGLREWSHELLESEPAFRAAIDAWNEAFASRELPLPADLLLAEDDPATELDLPLLFVLQHAAAQLWMHWGLEPDAVIGEGPGQYAAACAANMMDWEDGLLVAFLAGKLAADGSSETEALGAFEAAIDEIDHRPPDRPLICNRSGKTVPVHKVFGGAYWREHFGSEIALDVSALSLKEQGCRFWLEIGPSSGFAARLAAAAESDAIVLATPADGSRRTLVESLASLFVSGFNPDFTAFGKPWRCGKADVPTYPFQRKHYWIGANGSAPSSRS